MYQKVRKTWRFQVVDVRGPNTKGPVQLSEFEFYRGSAKVENLTAFQLTCGYQSLPLPLAH